MEMKRLRVLLVDDEKKFVRALRQYLEQQQMVVDIAFDGQEGLDKAMTGIYDLLIIDVMLPYLSGFELVQTLREQGDSTPTLLLTALDTVQNRVEGLDRGADDYLIKPFSQDELMARVRALTRRLGKVVGTDVLTVGDYKLDLITRSFTVCGVPMELSTKEFQLLELFLRNPDQVLPKVLIFDRIWGFEGSAGINLVEIYVHLLRKKLPTQCIETVRGVGYLFRGK